MEVLALLAEGLANRAIAQRLGISEHTVKFHLNAILGKLGAQSRTEAVVLAIRLGLLAT
jgi:DNA-binding NarL/FixJ family response regulator